MLFYDIFTPSTIQLCYVGLQSHVLGYVLRQQIVHEVRSEYEQISATIQSPELLQNLPIPLANEEINWPLENMLCFPTFSANKQHESCVGCHDDLFPVGGSEESEILPPSSTCIGPVVQTSTPKHISVFSHNPASSPQHTENGTDNEKQFDQPSFQCMMTSLECMMTSLPKDREALLELKSQLTLELLWIKQAIASRQEVSCVTHMHMCSSHE